MKLVWLYLLIIVVFSACKSGGDKAITTNDTNKTLFTIDTSKQQVDTLLLNKIDTAFVVKNKMIEDDMGDRYKNYIIHVYFTNSKWPVLIFKNAIGAVIVLTGDLDGDQQPELLLRPEWFSSCWASVNLFSLKNNKWNLIKSGSMYFCSDQYPLDKRIVKTAEGYGLLTDSLTEDKFITLKKTIKF